MKRNRIAALALSGLMLCMSALPMGAVTANATTTVTINPSTTADDTAEVTSVTAYQLLTLEESEEDGYIVSDLGSAFGDDKYVADLFNLFVQELELMAEALGWTYGDNDVVYPEYFEAYLSRNSMTLSKTNLFSISCYYAEYIMIYQNSSDEVVDTTQAAKYLAQDLELLCDYDSLDAIPYAMTNVFDYVASGSFNFSYTPHVTSTDGTIDIDELGYYIIVTEEKDTVTGATSSSYQILSVLGDEDEDTIEIDIKTSYPTVDKLVSDDDDDTSETGGTIYGYDTGYNFYETADHDIGETYYYALQATLYGDIGYSYYDHYQVTFHDYYTDGIDFGEILAVSVTVLQGDSVVKTEKLSSVSSYDEEFKNGNGYYFDEDSHTFNLKVYDLVSIVGEMSGDDEVSYWGNPEYDIVVEVLYAASLNDGANIATSSSECANNSSGNANDNTVFLTYSNNPSTCTDGFTEMMGGEYGGYNDDGTPVGTGSDVSDGTYDWQGNYEEAEDGDYEGKTIEDTVYVTTYALTVVKTNSSGELLQGAKFMLTYTDEDGVIYYLVGASYAVTSGESGTYYYYTVAEFSTTYESDDPLESDPYYLTIPETGYFFIIGLDAETYTLTEVKAPDGYDLPTGEAAETTITITAEHNETETGTGSTLVLSGTTIDSGSLDEDGTYSGITLYGASVAIVNSKNSPVTLPTTGGMGTVLFYTIGGVLFVGGALLLITKRRAEEFE